MSTLIKKLKLQAQEYRYLSLHELGTAWQLDVKRLPYSLLVLLENIARHRHDSSAAFRTWQCHKSAPVEIFFQPTRVLMQDFTGVPAIADLAAMRDKLAKVGRQNKVNPLSPVDLVIDHSVSVDHFGTKEAFARNMELEFKRNNERYQFLKWAQTSFNNLRVVPPGTGICHQVNLEYLAQVVWQDKSKFLYPDTVVGTDSHTTMVNALGVLGWGVGGIEAEAAMLQQPISMTLPDVCGVELQGELPEGATATDLVLKIVNALRAHGVVGKFVEFFGTGLDELTLAERATIANMSPEYGATCGFFPIDRETLAYLQLTGRSAAQLELVEAYSRAQCLWRGDHQPEFTDTLKINLANVTPALAGPKRPQDMIVLQSVPQTFAKSFPASQQKQPTSPSQAAQPLSSGAVVIAAITSCTNTSNPNVMISAGLLAKKAIAKGLATKEWVKTSLAPGSQVVSSYLVASGLQAALDKLGFQNVGHGCTTCIGNSGALSADISKAIAADDLVVCSVLSGNRNFEGRINQDVRANFLASPPLVVAYALVGRVDINLTSEPLGTDPQGKPVYLRDIWPSKSEVEAIIKACISPQMFKERYADVFRGPSAWQQINTSSKELYDWQDDSTYIRKPPFFELPTKPSKALAINAARLLLKLGDSITTDHISPAGAIKSDSPAGNYLRNCNVPASEFNSYGARRGNHEVMIRGTFANIRLKNLLLNDVEGGYTRHIPTGEQLSVYDAAMRYQTENTPLLVVAGKNYGSGSSRDWAAKGPLLLGVKAVICESIERIHRSNLIGMGVLPLEDQTGTLAQCNGDELFSLHTDALVPRGEVACVITAADNTTRTVLLRSRIDTDNELAYFLRGGILPYVAQSMQSQEESQ